MYFITVYEHTCTCIHTYTLYVCIYMIFLQGPFLIIADVDNMKLRQIIFLTLFNFLILTINVSCFRKQIAVRLFPKTDIKIQNCQIISKITSLS